MKRSTWVSRVRSDFASVVAGVDDEREYGHGVFFNLRHGYELDECHTVNARDESDARERLARVERCPDDCDVAAQRRA